MGGYVCFPGGMMASLLGKPLMLVNADAALLLSNKALLPVADRVAFGFDGAATRRRRSTAVVTGNPVRAEIEACPRRPRVMPAAAARCAAGGRWQPGRPGAQPDPAGGAGADPGGRTPAGHAPDRQCACWTRCAPPTSRRRRLPRCVPFIDDMARALADCDLIVCRAGAITVSELCAAGVPSVLVPLMVSTTAHQRDNAPGWRSTVRPCTCRRPTLTPERLADVLRGADARARCWRWRARARALAQAACRGPRGDARGLTKLA
jgi:UDP-N-acetylglucosamine--N-acetylmuramyl-(pentapeptide) pyrophosphoryl-undecaprenol N-acetylglucosamine transferase